MKAVSILGVDYGHLKTSDGGDLYLTSYGLSFSEHLLPESWYAPEWFAARRTRLLGTSTIYRVPTKTIRGISIDLVVRFSRVGQEVHLDPATRSENHHAEFNSPFEEFGLVMGLRAGRNGVDRPRIFTKKPLAIYVPAKTFQLWQTGRCESRIAAKTASHPEVPLDIRRSYILLYGWINGQDAVQTADALGLSSDSRKGFLANTTCRAIDHLTQRGFRMLDIKPQHILLRLRRDRSLLRQRDGEPAYALVDYELLERVRGPDQ